ncbi:hypothetical protein HEK616_71130 [Streptomyces nigrescens]|uniref:Uncharacterized protein n=1 Tax=Streptomyces nigrescens TaxID=1920 RepID=A0ABN6R832_STRNI|nr:hypothetical protein HEK616_71130 [Streptomyces nigrescens]
MSAAAAEGGAERLSVTLARHLQTLKIHDRHVNLPPGGEQERWTAPMTCQVPLRDTWTRRAVQ